MSTVDTVQTVKVVDEQELRAVYCRELIRLAERDGRIVVLDADLSKANGTGPFRERFPGRYFNVGVAEANMVGIAAGLAASGKIPFIASFTPFATRRVCDQVTVSLAYSNLHVVVVGTDPGIAAELNGGTHMSVEDVAIMRSIPNMKVVEITDANQLVSALPVIADQEGPVYLRLFRKNCRTVYSSPPPFTLGKGTLLREGNEPPRSKAAGYQEHRYQETLRVSTEEPFRFLPEESPIPLALRGEEGYKETPQGAQYQPPSVHNDAAILTTGIMVAESLDAAARLENQGIRCTVVNLHTLKPLDESLILELASTCGCLVTAENASIVGGLGSAVAELTARKHPVPVEMVGIQDRFGVVGKLDYLMDYFSLNAQAVEKAVHDAIARKK